MTEREKIIKRLRGAELSKRSVFNLEHVVSAIDGHNVYDEWTFDECKQLRDKLIDLLSTGKKNERITNELRKWLDKYTMRKDTYDKMIAIIDRIDITHDEALSKVYMDMSDSEWMRLPKDADGKHIHEHDKVDWRDHSGTWHKNVLVVAVCNDGCYVMDGMVFHVHASDIRHYHEPTVEDVLRDMHAKLDEVTALYVGEAIDADERNHDEARIIAEYAAKLRLAGDAE